eukprot:CAMPEP_0114999618 /NCGR_PEP_ID=MMETSP0216-20121206/16253_1 /TAXON_ID=223996 /ORGANISM="Protocruzia adherens, Strain Boccale" /LENGTH=279 /DNA_ID=CAMNT_0002364527 /DNA_START=683 /DNA_END=1523 /DNA_ORIENTATION=+
MATTLDKKCEEMQKDVEQSLEQAHLQSLHSASTLRLESISDLESVKRQSSGMFSSWTFAQTVEQKTNHDYRDYRPFEIRAKLSQKSQTMQHSPSTKTVKQLAEIPEENVNSFQFKETPQVEGSENRLTRRGNLERINSESTLLDLQIEEALAIQGKKHGHHKHKSICLTKSEVKDTDSPVPKREENRKSVMFPQLKLDTLDTVIKEEEYSSHRLRDSSSRRSLSKSSSPSRAVIVLQEKSGHGSSEGYQTVNVVYPRKKLHDVSDVSKSRIHSLLQDDL